MATQPGIINDTLSSRTIKYKRFSSETKGTNLAPGQRTPTNIRPISFYLPLGCKAEVWRYSDGAWRRETRIDEDRSGKWLSFATYSVNYQYTIKLNVHTA